MTSGEHDGLVADEHELHGPRPSIRGRAWCGPGGQERWTFTLLLHSPVDDRNLIDWSACYLLTTSRDGSPLNRNTRP
jgi:hypothetical protein